MRPRSDGGVTHSSELNLRRMQGMHIMYFATFSWIRTVGLGLECEECIFEWFWISVKLSTVRQFDLGVLADHAML